MREGNKPKLMSSTSKQKPVAKQPRTRQSNGLTEKQNKLVKGIVEGKTQRQAARAAGYTGNDRTVDTVASQTLSSPKVKDVLEQAFAEAGFSAKSIASVVTDAMTATKKTYADGEMFEEVDHSTRLNAVRTGTKILGIGEKEGGGDTITFNIGTKNYLNSDGTNS